MQKQKSWRVILLWIIYLAVSAVGFVMNVQRQDMQAVGMGVVALITPWIVPVVMRLCRLKMTEEIWIIDLLFTFFASLIGSCFGGRDHTTVKYAVEKVQDKMQNDAKFKREIEVVVGQMLSVEIGRM